MCSIWQAVTAGKLRLTCEPLNLAGSAANGQRNRQANWRLKKIGVEKEKSPRNCVDLG